MRLRKIRPDNKPQQTVRWRPLGKFLVIAAVLSGAVFTLGGQVPTARAAACPAPAADLGVDTLTMNIPAAGEYTIWTRMVAADAQNNSINLQVDSTDCFDVGGGSFAATTWADDASNWVDYTSGSATPVRLSLSAGSHTLKYVGTKGGVQVDRIIVTADACQPTGLGDNCLNNTPVPGAPANLRTSLVASTSVALAWDANAGAVSYVIYRNGTEVGTSQATNYTDTTVQPDTTYSYTVASKDAAGTLSPQSAPLSVKTLSGAGGNPNPTPPGPSTESRIYVTPASGAFAVGTTLEVSVRVDSKADPVNTAQADITYTPNLEFVSINTDGNDYSGGCPSRNGGSGTVTLACFIPVASGQEATPLTGDKLLGKLTFRVLAAGDAKVDVLDTSVALSSVDAANKITAREDGNYTLQAPAPPVQPQNPPAPTPPAPAPTPPAPAPRPTPPAVRPSTPPATSTPRPATSGTTTTIAPQGTTQPVTLPNNTEVELSDPVIVQTVPDSNQVVEKVEYYLNGKLIKTVKEAPYSYSVDTKNLKNGTYKLTTKTYYEDGTVDTKDANLVVKNPMSFKQIMLQLGGLVWLIVLILIAAAGAVAYIFFRGRNNGGGDDGFGDDDSYMFGPNGPSGPGGPSDPYNTGGPAGPPGPGTTFGPPPTGQAGPYGSVIGGLGLVPQPVAVAISDDLPAGRY